MSLKSSLRAKIPKGAFTLVVYLQRELCIFKAHLTNQNMII